MNNANNINTFAENMSKLTENSQKVLSMAEGINEAMKGNNAEVYISEELAIPSFSNIVKRVERAENTIARFTEGKGVVETDDGSFRKIKVTTISRPPQAIDSLAFENKFSINPNWFFESLQYPRCVVKLNLTGKIEESSDRVYVVRVMLEATDDNVSFYENYIKNNNLNYNSLISLLETKNIAYREDKDEINLPLTYERYYGEFGIVGTSLVQGEDGISRLWYQLENTAYNIVDENGIEISAGHSIKAGDYLRFNDSLFKIKEFNPANSSVKLEYAVGYQTPGAGDKFEFYNEPFSEKQIEIGIGINEIDIVYVKGVNEDYNLVSKDWSTPVMFITNDLTYSEDENITFAEYYSKNVADFGKAWISQMKEGQVYAYGASDPNTPVLNENDFQVVQINTQLDATLDTETYNNLTSQIAQTKSNISAVRTTIASNKDLLIQSSSSDERANIQNLINTDTESLNSLTTQYNSLVEELNTLLTETGAINYSPKYHIRGFFAIPEPVNNEQVIGFDIMYRYLHNDETGVKLNTYEYTKKDSNNNDIIQTGVFTDWNLAKSSVLEKVFDINNDIYVWKEESTADGTKININQIDIPIRSGEKVEIKVRSISEAGYPTNPRKSSWSNSIIISFPDNLTSNDTVTTILDTVKSDMTAVVLQETMSAAGVYTHLAESNSMYKHTAKTVSYTDIATDDRGQITLVETSVQDKIDAMGNQMNEAAKEISDSLANTLVDYEKEITDIKKLLGYRDNGKEKVGVGTGLPPEYLSESGINSLADKVNVLNELVSRIMDALGLSSQN